MSKAVSLIVYSNSHPCLVNLRVSGGTSSRQFVNRGRWSPGLSSKKMSSGACVNPRPSAMLPALYVTSAVF